MKVEEVRMGNGGMGKSSPSTRLPLPLDIPFSSSKPPASRMGAGRGGCSPVLVGLVPGAFSESNRVKAGQAIFPPSQALTRIRRRREVSLKVSYPQQDGRGTFVL